MQPKEKKNSHTRTCQRLNDAVASDPASWVKKVPDGRARRYVQEGGVADVLGVLTCVAQDSLDVAAGFLQERERNVTFRVETERIQTVAWNA